MNLYDVSVPVYVKMLGNLVQVLEKGRDWTKENGKDESEVLASQLAPDMFPLSRQVQLASDHAKSVSSRLAGSEPPKMEDIEKTFPELIARTEKTIAFLKTLERAKFEGAETRHIPFPYVPGTYLMGDAALFESSLPNFFFHVTTAYAILRHIGVPLGKTDYIGTLPLHKNEA